MFTLIKAFIGVNPVRQALVALAAVIGIFLAVYAVNRITGSIMGVFGFDTVSSLKKKLTTSENNVTAVVDANKGLSKAVTDISATKDNELKAIENAQTESTKTEQKAQVILKKKDSRVAAVKDKVAKNKLSKELAVKEISGIQIDVLWEAYCEFNEDSSCTAAKKE